MQLKVSPISRQECNEAEWQARVDLAAAHRIAVMHGFNEGIFNHLTLTVPGRSDRYYQIPFGMHWSEVKASSFMEVGIDDGRSSAARAMSSAPAICIHAPIHKALPHAAAVFHTHMPYASALTRLEDPRIKEIGQTEVLLMNAIAYDDDYTGPAFEPEEGERLAKIIGKKSILFMANHGITDVRQDRRASLRPPLLRGARRAGADLRHVDRPAPEAAAGARRRGHPQREDGQLLRSLAVRAPLRGAEAHPRPQGARLRRLTHLSWRPFAAAAASKALISRISKCSALVS
jgi:ribulose-5-phosphate 4-epimerase/fuculose-1-phosphate aldolase